MTTTGLPVAGRAFLVGEQPPALGLQPRTSKNEPETKLPTIRCGSSTAGQVHALRRATGRSHRIVRSGAGSPRIPRYERRPCADSPRAVPIRRRGDRHRGYGSGRSSTALTMLNIAVLAPMPSASVKIATKREPGLRRHSRSAKRMSCQQLVHHRSFSASPIPGAGRLPAACRTGAPAAARIHSAGAFRIVSRIAGTQTPTLDAPAARRASIRSSIASTRPRPTSWRNRGG